jgi:N-acetylglucosamine-6-phosphate deacetylase
LEDVVEIHVNGTHNTDTNGTVAVEEKDSMKKEVIQKGT